MTLKRSTIIFDKTFSYFTMFNVHEVMMMLQCMLYFKNQTNSDLSGPRMHIRKILFRKSSETKILKHTH